MGASHQFDEALKVMLGVVRAGSSLRVILYGEDGKPTMAHAFHAIVVEIDVCDFDLRRQALSLDGKAMIV